MRQHCLLLIFLNSNDRRTFCLFYVNTRLPRATDVVGNFPLVRKTIALFACHWEFPFLEIKTTDVFVNK